MILIFVEGLKVYFMGMEFLVGVGRKLGWIQPKLEHNTSRKSGIDDCIPNKVVKLLLEAGLFRDSRLPARYWSFDLSFLTTADIVEFPLTLAIYTCNIYAIRLLLDNGYNVEEVRHHHDGYCNCMEHKGTALTYAIWLGYTEAVTVLLEAGADITKMGPQAQTAAEMAGLCLSIPMIKGCAEKTGLEDRDDDMGSSHRVFDMVCANLQSTCGKDYVHTIDEIHKIEPRIPFLRLSSILIAYTDINRECADRLQITTPRPLAIGRELNFVFIARLTY